MRKRFNGESCEPGGEVGIDRPTAVRAHGVLEERCAALGHRMILQAHAGQAHCYEGGEWSGFEETTVRRLKIVEARQRLISDEIANESRQRIFRRGVMVDRL